MEANAAKKNENSPMGEFGRPVLDYKTAKKHVNDWLDKKKVKPNKRENFDDNIEELVAAFQTGQLILNDNDQIEMNLSFEVGHVEKLTFKTRLSYKEKRPHLRKVKPGDIRGTMVGTACALTNESVGIIEGLDSEDFDIVSSIALFFF